MEIIVIAFIVMQTLFVFWLFILTLKVNRLKGDLAENIRVKKEMEQLFESYIMEMRMENETLLKQLKTPSTFQNREKKTVESKLPTMRTQKYASASVQPSFFVDDMTPELKSKDSIGGIAHADSIEQITYKKPVFSAAKPTISQKTVAISNEKDSDAIPSLTIGNADVDENLKREEVYAQSLTAQVLLLQKQGYSLDKIAKQLNKGKTELELLLKFRK